MKDRIFFLLIGLFIGLTAGYMVSDYYFRQMENQSISAKENPHANMDNIRQEINMLTERLQKNPEDYGAFVALGNIYYDAQMFDKALTFYKKAYAIHGDDANLITDMATCYREMGQPEEALKYYEEAFRKDSQHWQSLYNAVIVAFHDMKDKEKARTYFQKLQRIAPPDVDLQSLQKALEN